MIMISVKKKRFIVGILCSGNTLFRVGYFEITLVASNTHCVISF